MEYRVEEIARAAGISVDTVRFYQSRGLLPSPERRGRVAFYGDDHLERLRRIRELNRQGLTLEAVGRLLAAESSAPARDPNVALRDPLKGALAEAEGQRSYTRAELSASSGVPEMLLEVLDRAGLLETDAAAGDVRYTDADLRTVEAARRLLDSGFPLHELMPLALRHAEHVAEVSDAAIELFDRYVRRVDDGDDAASREQVAETFREVLPAVTTLVAEHFQRTLIQHARARLDHAGEDDALQAALAASEGRRLHLSWGK